MPAIAALLLCLQFVTDAAPPPASQPWPPSPIRFHTFDNGLRVIAVEEPSLPNLSVQLWYRAGSALDPPDAPGLVHAAWTVLQHTDAAAARWSFHTARDACWRERFVDRADLDAALAELQQSLHPLRVTTAMRDGALVGRGADEAVAEMTGPARPPVFLPPSTRMPAVMTAAEWTELLSAALPDHPYAHPPTALGSAAVQADARRLQEVLNRWFVPSNATVFIIGDLSAPLAIDAARARLTELPWSPAPRRPELPRPERATVRRESTDGGLLIAWVAPPWSYVENAAIDVVMQRLCNPADGPLWITARRLELHLTWDRLAWRDCGLLVLAVRPGSRGGDGPQRCRQFEEALDPALAALGDEPWDPVALRRARTLAWRELLNLRSDPQCRAWRIAAHEMIGGDAFLTEYESSLLAHMPLGEARRGVEVLRTARRVILAPRSERAEPRAGPAAAALRWLSVSHETGPATSRSAPQAAEFSAGAQRAAGRLQVHVDQRPADELAQLRIALEPSGVVNILRDQMHVAESPYSWPMLLELSSYRGFEWRIDTGGGTPQLAISAPAHELSALVELAAAVVLELPAAATVTRCRLTILAPHPPADVLELCDRFWTPRFED
jgi:zinc protease